MNATERKIRFEIALEMVERIYSDYCRDQSKTREEVQNFCYVVQQMIAFTTTLDEEARKAADTKDYITTKQNRIRNLRRKHEISQKELGQRLGVKQVTVSAWERGKNIPHYKALCEMSQIFHCSIGYLMGTEGGQQ